MTMKFNIPLVTAIGITMALPAAAETEEIVVSWSGGTWGDAFQECIADPFTEATGVRVIPEVGTSSVTLAKLQQQVDNPSIDVAWIDGGISEMAVEAGVVDYLDPAKIPNIENLEKKAVYRNSEGIYGVSDGFFSIGLTYNTDEIPEPPKSWKELWNPAYAGAVTIPSPSNSSGVPFIFFLTEVLGGSADDLAPVFDKLKELDTSLLYDSGGAATNAFQNGEAIIGAHYSSMAWEMIDKGLPIGFVVPEEGVWGGDGRIHLVKGTKNKEVAEQFINSSLTKEVANCIVSRLFVGPAIPDTPIPAEIMHKMPWGENGSIDDLVLFDWTVMNAKRAEINDIWNREIAVTR